MDQIKRFQSKIPQQVDAVLIRSYPNRFYFTGFSSSAGTLLMTREQSWFIIDSRYIESAQQQISNCQVLLETNLEEQLRQLLAEQHIQRIGTETAYLTAQEFWNLQQALRPAVLLEDGEVQQAILRQRRIKTPEEIEYLAKAQAITDEALAAVRPSIQAGISDLEVAIQLGTYMSRHGSERKSYDFILTSGPNTSRPHGGGGNRIIQDGDFVMMDMGSSIHGYDSDMTRTIAVGNISEKQKKIYQIVLEAQYRALELIRPGACCREVDAAARDYICQQGYGDCFGHGLGHSLGVEIHESPRFNQVCEDLLEPGVVMTVEPGIYLPGEFGVRIEDMVVVTENGYRNLTGSPKVQP